MSLKECKLEKAHTCKESDNIEQVSKKLKSGKVRHLYVLNSKKEPVGVVSVTDVVNRVIAAGKNPKKSKAKDVMTKPVKCVELKADAADTYYSMVRNNVFSCPVVDDKGKISGVITMHEAMKAVLKRRK